MRASLLILLCVVMMVACKSKQQQNVIIFHAGSLSLPVKRIAQEFEKIHPDIKILTEASGSLDCARKITELKKECDIMASADYAVIDKVLIPDYASWNIPFAANEMAIVFTEKSKYAGEINANNWCDILLKEEVITGRANPDADPCGYRTVLTLMLAEQFYQREGFAVAMQEKDKNFIRPKEVDLISLLEVSAVDYIFLYKSVAEQHGLLYLSLPREIHLGDPALSDRYATVSVEIKSGKPGDHMTMRGEPMVYGITILDKAPHKEAALRFVEFLLDKEGGMKIMEESGQKSVLPAHTESFMQVPVSLKQHVKY